MLLHSLTLQPADRLASEAAAKAWLDAATDSYATSKGVSLPRPGSSAAGAAGGGGFSPELLAALLGGGGGGGSGGGGAPVAIPDAPVTAIQFIRTLLALKLS